ncbi:MAG: bifunctional diguanylate cyclase/phosphodiesterase [Eggerthellaceae bacterium]|nr:bifunctional diguanylate cyclase/phosphodiesterase [Eggerthellaceae bacterium]
MYVERDQLTGARDYFVLRKEFPFDAYKGEAVYFAVCDVDNFTQVNVEFGRVLADRALARVVEVMQACFGDEHVFRYGSDEFIVANAFFTEDAFLDKVDSLLRQVAKIMVEGRHLNLTMSVGYTYGYIATPNDVHEAIHMADRMMYEAKRLGKARAAGSVLHVDHPTGASSDFGVARKTYEIDELTGLANLISFRSQLERVLQSGIGEGDNRLTLVYLNIENFKTYNERFGFEAGDELLLLISGAIKEAFPGSLMSRFSSDQFMVASDRASALPGIASVRRAFRARVKDSSIWLNAGLYVVDDSDENVGLLCDRAKLACDAIKGRRDVYWREYDSDLKHQILLRRYVLDHFDDALENGWVKIFYQPIMRVATDEVCDEEALARWVDPEKGVLSPAAFIPVLEEARLIHRLDLYMIRRACENMRRIQDYGIEVAPVSINLSRLDFELCDIVAEVQSILDEFGISHDMLSIEVTESALAGNQEFLKSEIDRFRAAGFEVWMDDFGSGYSSLHLLTDYNFDLVKVDMGFLRDFETNEQTRVMLAHIISMTKELGYKTLVEGVETSDQYEFLKTIGCGRAQGYYLGKPASLRDVEKASDSDEYPPIEIDSSHSFYEAVGRVNLMRPDPVPAIAGHYVPGDIAAAIVCRTKGSYRYYNVTEMYRVHLGVMGASTIAEATARLNDPLSSEHECFERVLARAPSDGSWVDDSYSAHGSTCKLHMRLIASYDQGDAKALLVTVRETAEK